MDRYMVRPALGVMIATDMEPRLQAGDADYRRADALGRVVSATFGGASPAATRARTRMRRHPARRSRSPRPIARSTTSPASSDEATSPTEATIDAIEARTGAEVVVYTQVAALQHHDRGDRARTPGAHRPVGRRARGFDDGLVIFFDLDPSLEHGQVQLYAAPGFEATFLSNRSARRSSRTTCCRYLRDGDLDGALLGVAMERIDAAATPETRRSAPARAADQRGRRPGRRADRVHAASSGWAIFIVAPVRQGPGLPRRPVDPHAGPAAGPDGRIGGDRHGRRHLAARADDRDARPREPRADRVPRGVSGCSRARSAGDRIRDAGTDPEARRSAATRAARSGRPEDYALERAPRARRRRGGRVHRGRRLPKFGTDVGRVRHGLEQHVVEQGLVRREAEQGRRLAGRARRPGDRSAGSSSSSAGFAPGGGLVLIGGRG